MKALLVLIILATLGVILLSYRRTGNRKKTLVALASFGVIVSLGIAGNITRAILPLFVAHLVLLVFAWLGLLYYLWRGRYYWWVVLSPLLSIGLFLLLELTEGSGHEYLG